MKKTSLMTIVTAIILVFGTINLVHAGEEQDTKKGDMMSGQKMMMGHGMMDRYHMGGGMMQGMPMCGMMSKSMVATDGGGVIIMMGNKLYKYDKNLKLIKETEIPVDYKKMKKMMMKIHTMDMEMCKEMMQQNKSGPDKSSE